MAEGGFDWKKGCAIGGLALLALSCIACVVMGITCRGLYGLGQGQLVTQVLEVGRRQAASHPRRAEYEAELDRFAEIGPTMGVLSSSILQNRFTDVRADGAVTPDELDALMALVHDINEHRGDVELSRYPGGR